MPDTPAPATLPLPAHLRQRDQPRLAAYAAALAFYEGKQWPHARTTVTRLRRLTLNYVRVITQKTASYVVKGATVGVRPLSETDEAIAAAAAAEDALTEIAAANAIPRLDYVTEVDTAVIGDGAFKVIWDDQEERVAITSPDMAGIYPWPHPTDLTRFRRVAHRYQLPAPDVYKQWRVRAKKDPSWVIEDWTDDALAIYIDDDLNAHLAMTNPYGFLPFVIFPNTQVPKRWYGESDITPLTEIAEEINAEFSRTSNILELSGNPIAVLENVEQSQGIETYPGAVWEIPEKAKAYVLDMLEHGGAKMHLDYIDLLMRALHDLSETPKTAFGDTGRDLSGVALAVEMQPLLQKVARKRAIRSDAYATRATLALALTDLYTGTNHAQAGPITVSWEAPTPHDRTRQVQDEATQIDAYIKSRRTSIAELGHPDPDAEWERIQDELRVIKELETPHGIV